MLETPWASASIPWISWWTPAPTSRGSPFSTIWWGKRRKKTRTRWPLWMSSLRISPRPPSECLIRYETKNDNSCPRKITLTVTWNDSSKYIFLSNDNFAIQTYCIFSVTCKWLSEFDRFTVDALTGEVRQVKTSVTKLRKDLDSCPDDVRNQLKTFIQVRVDTIHT